MKSLPLILMQDITISKRSFIINAQKISLKSLKNGWKKLKF